MAAPARQAALSALRAIHRDGAALSDVVAAFRARLRDPRDVALASEIVIGTARWRRTLDWLIERASSRPLDRLDAPVLDILRLSAYQLVHLDRVPPSAVVNDAVALTRAAGQPFATGFVNAVLRRLADPAARPALPPPPATPDRRAWIEYLSVTWSHPAWLVARWYDKLGRDDTRARLAHNQSPAPLTLRPGQVNGDVRDLEAALTAAGVETAPAAWAAGARTVVTGNPWHAPGVDPGVFAVQDEASQLVARFTGAGPGNTVLDACAAPGGKTVLLASAMQDTGLLVAGDLRPARVRLLRDTIAASGARCIRVVRHDVASLPFRAAFDLVLLDVPCSGLGTLRRDPDLKWRRREDDLGPLSLAERQMLDAAARTVRPGGYLVYATCSSEPEENEEVAAWFLRTHRDYRPEPPTAGWDTNPLGQLVDAAGRFRTLPERHGLDAFFAARFRRNRAGKGPPVAR
jgi:16S rRNA (cytosine967-C5)-methyltransferase